ncbi:hypothetical protein [Paenibacillus cymbidii]|uniref:hypothetical protein n=1 Tax=Paenibacillus cymbidii TaxID=1639034 RepID=UPI001080D84F|nr:hypothetical protein [Paenibacillus cymbidii]
MTNYSVYNNIGNPLYTQLTNTYAAPGVEALPASDAAKNGSLFVLNSGSIALSAGQSILQQIANPSAGTKTFYISSVSGGGTAAATVTLYSGGTISGGTTTPFNMRLGSANASAATARQNTGTLGGTPASFLTVPVTAGQYTISLGGSVVVSANQTFSVTIGPGAATASLAIIWWEV